MASISELKQRIDLHDLAAKLGLVRPGKNSGNYRSPGGDDKNPSLSVFDNGKAFKDFKENVGGDAIALVMHVEGIPDVPTAMRRLHELYGIEFDKREEPAQRRERSQVEFIADQCTKEAESVVAYLVGRGVPEETVRWAIGRGAVGFSSWVNPTKAAGEYGYAGPAAAFICRDLTGAVRAIDYRYLDPDTNGGVKTKSKGDKEGVPYFVDRSALSRARTVVIVESAINVLCVEACKVTGWAALALRGTGTVASIDWHFLQGKNVIIALDADLPDMHGQRPGAKASWELYDTLTGLNIATQMVDQSGWYRDGFNDVADIAKAQGIADLRERLHDIEPWVIPGLVGRDAPGGKSRVFLPAHDFGVYWKFRAKADFTSYISKVEKTDDGDGEQRESFTFEDLCSFRIAALTRITIQSATATMSGEVDNQPNTLFAVSVQTARHGAKLVRRVMTDDRLHNPEHWKKFGSVYSPTKFFRLVSIMERSVDCGSRNALNFVGLAWRNGKPVVNEGTDCYFTEPEKQCPYHALTFPTGSITDARSVLNAYQSTFRDNAALQLLTWALGAHLKAFLGFWPHMIMQADKGSGKSTLVKRLERSIGMTMFGGQSLQTEFRLLTSISHTSHPVGWEEISARRQDVINTAVGMLQENYQFTITRRGSDLTEFLASAPVLLAGEDVPVKSLTGKVVRVGLTGRMGQSMSESLPRFPVRQWLEFLTTVPKERVMELHKQCEAGLWKTCRANQTDTGASRMVRNYAAIATAWMLLCEFADIPADQGNFKADLREAMNTHIAETSGDRQPWVWILERAMSDIDSHQFTYPYSVSIENGERCLVIRPNHVMDHLSSTPRLRDEFNALPVKSGRVFKAQLEHAGVIVADKLDRFINRTRHTYMSAISLDRLAEYGLHMSVPEDNSGDPAPNHHD